MPISKNFQDRDFQSFVEDDAGNTARRIYGAIKPSGLNIGGLITEVVLNSVTWTALPALPLASRNSIAIQNTSGIEIKINYDNGVGTYT